jgi:hypothetical protein
MLILLSLNRIVSLLDSESKTWEHFDQKLIQSGTGTLVEGK